MRLSKARGHARESLSIALSCLNQNQGTVLLKQLLVETRNVSELLRLTADELDNAAADEELLNAKI